MSDVVPPHSTSGIPTVRGAARTTHEELSLKEFGVHRHRAADPISWPYLTGASSPRCDTKSRNRSSPSTIRIVPTRKREERCRLLGILAGVPMRPSDRKWQTSKTKAFRAEARFGEKGEMQQPPELQASTRRKPVREQTPMARSSSGRPLRQRRRECRTRSPLK